MIYEGEGDIFVTFLYVLHDKKSNEHAPTHF